MPTCEVALRCTDPCNGAEQCLFYVETSRWKARCKHAETIICFCGHPEARRAAFREMVREAMGIGVTDAAVPKFDARDLCIGTCPPGCRTLTNRVCDEYCPSCLKKIERGDR